MNDSEVNKEYINPVSSAALDFSKSFDLAYEDKNIALVLSLIDEVTLAIPSFDNISQAYLFYSLGTAFGDLSVLDPIHKNENNLERQIYYYRNSIANIEKQEQNSEKNKPYINGLKRVLYTNYANSLDKCGRKIAAVEYYKKALYIDSRFGMALGNLGIAYKHYGSLEYDNTRRDYFHNFAYHYLVKAIKNEKNDVYLNALNDFKHSVDEYDKEYVSHVLKKELKIPQYSYDNPLELTYRQWCLKNTLFLNPLNDLPVHELCFAADVLHLPNMVIGIDAKPIFHGLFNQLKQEFIFSRYQYYNSLQIPTEVHFADKDTYLLNFADYPQYSIRLENMKSAFRSLYSLLDKVAFFITKYFDLGIKERDISYYNIWLSEKVGHNGYKYKNQLNPNENYALSSIFWISKDFYTRLHDSPNPEAKRISELRHALEHRYVKIVMKGMPIQNIGDVDDFAMYITENQLSEYVIQILKIIREVLINLSLAIHIEESKKAKKRMNDIIIPKINFMNYDDDWKI